MSYLKILGEELLTITTEYAKFDKINKRLDKCTKCGIVEFGK